MKRAEAAKDSILYDEIAMWHKSGVMGTRLQLRLAERYVTEAHQREITRIQARVRGNLTRQQLREKGLWTWTANDFSDSSSARWRRSISCQIRDI